MNDEIYNLVVKLGNAAGRVKLNPNDSDSLHKAFEELDKATNEEEYFYISIAVQTVSKATKANTDPKKMLNESIASFEDSKKELCQKFFEALDKGVREVLELGIQNNGVIQ